NVQKLSAKTLTKWATTVLTSHPAHRLGVPRPSSSSSPTWSAIMRRSAATAAKTRSRSMPLLISARDAAQNRVPGVDQGLSLAEVPQDVLGQPLFTDDASGQHPRRRSVDHDLARANALGE